MIFGKQTLHVMALCYNEELLLPHFIKHYRGMGADRITVFDNESTDSSVKIAKEGGCEITSWTSGGQIRDDLYLSLKNNIWKTSKENWVIVCDMDEFLHVDPVDFSEFNIIQSQGFDILGLPPSNFGVPNILYSKTIMFKPSAIAEINYRVGAHTCIPQFRELPKAFRSARLFHYNHISEVYVYCRRLQYQQRLSEVNKEHGWGANYQLADFEAINANFEALRTNGKPNKGKYII